jgi:hypothetical protein
MANHLIIFKIYYLLLWVRRVHIINNDKPENSHEYITG